VFWPDLKISQYSSIELAFGNLHAIPTTAIHDDVQFSSNDRVEIGPLHTDASSESTAYSKRHDKIFKFMIKKDRQLYVHLRSTSLCVNKFLLVIFAIITCPEK